MGEFLNIGPDQEPHMTPVFFFVDLIQLLSFWLSFEGRNCLFMFGEFSLNSFYSEFM